MTFKAPDSLAEQIAHHLAERIIRGELKERERIQEQKVTQTLNVSRGSVREALLILERRHLVNILPRAAQVSELSPQHVESLYALIVRSTSCWRKASPGAGAAKPSWHRSWSSSSAC